MKARHKYDRDTLTALAVATLTLAAPAAQAQNTRLAVGQGPDPTMPARIRVFDTNGALQKEIAPYAALYGANVGFGDVDADGRDEVLAGPGPGVTYGPQVKAYRIDGAPVQRVNYYAYGTLNYGVNVSGNGLSLTPREEMITGPGPGAVFGPHVRGFWLSPTGVKALPSVNFFAFSGLRRGARVGNGDFDGDGWDDILVTPGIGGTMSGFVAAFSATGGGVTPIFSVLLGTGPVSAAGGDIDGDPYAELLTGSGPSSVTGAQVRGFNVDGGTMSAIARLNFYASACLSCGAVPALGDLDGDPYDEIVVTLAGGPAIGTDVLTFDFDGSSLGNLVNFVAYPAGGFGALAAVSDSAY